MGLRRLSSAAAVGLVVVACCAADRYRAPVGDETRRERWLDRTLWLESRGDHSAVGDAGRSRGGYQVQERVWRAYSRVPWRIGAHNPVESRRVARMILIDCERACARDGRPVTWRHVRWYYRHGGYPTPRTPPG